MPVISVPPVSSASFGADIVFDFAVGLFAYPVDIRYLPRIDKFSVFLAVADNIFGFLFSDAVERGRLFFVGGVYVNPAAVRRGILNYTPGAARREPQGECRRYCGGEQNERGRRKQNFVFRSAHSVHLR